MSVFIQKQPQGRDVDDPPPSHLMITKLFDMESIVLYLSSALAVPHPMYALVMCLSKYTRVTHFLEACRQQRAIRAEYPLSDNSTAVARPRALHLSEHPLISSDFLRIVEVDRAGSHDQYRHSEPRLATVVVP
jgi:hypothetical protein